MTDPKTDSLIALLLDSLLLATPAAGLAEPRPALRAEILAATEIDGTGHPFLGFRRRFARLFDLSLADADTVLMRMSDPAAWLPIQTLRLHHFMPGPRCRATHAGLVRCAPGLPFPIHRHTGPETTLFLRGTVRDEDTGELFLPGDLVTRPAGSLHRLMVLPPYECVFAILMEDGFPDFDPQI